MPLRGSQGVSERTEDRIRTQALESERRRLERSIAAAQAIARGEIQVPLRCGHCRTPSVVEDYDRDDLAQLAPRVRCLQCGRTTLVREAHKLRRQEMRMIISAGVDPRPHTRGA
jgi:hypothetical protein